MFKGLQSRRSRTIGSVLFSLGLLGISWLPVAAAPRLLWHTEPQHG